MIRCDKYETAEGEKKIMVITHSSLKKAFLKLNGRTFKNIAEDRGYSYRKASAVLKKDLERLVNSYYIGLIFGYEKFIKTTSVKDLRLSKRSMLALIRNNINTLADIRAIGCAKLKALRFIGDESYNEIIFKTWFLWDSERQVKLSARYKDNIKAILTGKGWKAKEISHSLKRLRMAVVMCNQRL